MKTKVIEVDSIGPVLFRRNWRARRLSISIKPFQGIQSTIPFGVSFREAKRVVVSKIDWIQKSLERIKKAEDSARDLSRTLPKIDKHKAKAKLVKRTEELSKLYGFRYKKIFIRSQRTRWGSCSADNNINLNMRLVQLEPELMDYVILHELLHTRIKNHSREFWAELGRYVGDPKRLNKGLKRHGLKLF